MSSSSSNHSHPSKSHKINTILLSMVSSGLAELVTVPIDTVKVHLQANISQSIPSKTNPILRSVKEIYRYDGIKGFYRSSVASVGRQMLSGGVRMGLFDWINLYWKKDTYTTSQKIISNMGQGAICGVVSSSISMPFDLVKTRVQAVQGTSQNMGVTGMIKYVWKQHGLVGFYHGYRQTMERSVSISMIQMPVYFTIQEFLKSQDKLNLDLNLRSTLSTIGATLATTALVYPIDMVKTQIQYSGTNRGTLGTMKYLIQTHGIRSLYRGCLVGFSRAFPQFWLTSLFYENLKQLNNN